MAWYSEEGSHAGLGKGVRTELKELCGDLAKLVELNL